MSEKYKVGDRVRIVSSPFCSETRQAGAVGTVSQVPSRVRGDVEIEFKGDAGPWGFQFHEIEHAEYKPVKGDRVRVVIEDEVVAVYKDEIHIANAHTGGALALSPTEPTVVSVEKIEPPVEVFKPGDVVRGKSNGLFYSIGRDGYLSHATHKFFEWYPVGLSEPDSFTSKGYEKVSLG